MHPFHSLPEDFRTRLEQIFPSSSSLSPNAFSPRPSAIRLNTLRARSKELLFSLSSESIQVKSVPFWEYAWIVAHASARTLTDTAAYKKGWFYIQNLSSMLPALLLDPQPDEQVLDLCAAPGSKTTQLAALMGNTGSILANDTSRQRGYKLGDNLRQQGVTNTMIHIRSGQSLWQEYPAHFDKTLVDVPCSMEGRFDLQDPTSWAHWSQKKVKKLAKIQQWLLRSAASATKPGGRIVYSTCTLSPEENEGVIDWLLRKYPGTVEVEDVQLPLIPQYAAIQEWNGRAYDPGVRGTLRVMPDRSWEGFYVAVLRKVGKKQ